MSDSKKYWMGSDPAPTGNMSCDICSRIETGMFVDGETTMGSWANMCCIGVNNCFKHYGVGLGTGKGQQYQRQEDHRWLKIGG